jgi:DNA-binding MltR family transcriptional regulator
MGESPVPMLWYGRDEYRIDPSAFEQITNDSDRAAGLVAAAIVEQRLEEIIKFWLEKDVEVQEKLFRFSGPLGTFSVKIDLAYLMGIITPEGRKDLIKLKDIRNDFAHKLEVDSFKVQSIADRCKSLRLVETHVIEPSPQRPFKRLLIQERNGRPYLLGYEGITEELKDARRRYIITAQLLSFFLGRAVDYEDRRKPYF